MKIIDL